MNSTDKEFYSRKFYTLKGFFNKLIFFELIIYLSIVVLFFGTFVFEINFLEKYFFNIIVTLAVTSVSKIIFIHHYSTFCGFYGYLLKNDKTIYED